MSDLNDQLYRRYSAAPEVDVESLAVGLEYQDRRRRRVRSVAGGAAALVIGVLAAGAVLGGPADKTIPVTAGGSSAGSAPVVSTPDVSDKVRLAPADQVPDGRVEITAGNIFLDLETEAGVEGGLVPAGWVELKLTNSQPGQHWLEIEELPGLRLEVYQQSDVDTAVVWLEPGTYTLFDSTPGYRPAGGVAIMTVVAASDIDAEAALPTTG